MDEKAVIEARKKAEHAVSDMADGELKVKAFELIFNRLLSAEPVATPGALNRAKRDAKKRTGRSPSAENQPDGVPRSAPARILELKSEGFFDQQRGIGEIREELQTHGWMYELTALSGTLMNLVRARELRRAKVNDGNKTTYKYFNP